MSDRPQQPGLRPQQPPGIAAESAPDLRAGILAVQQQVTAMWQAMEALGATLQHVSDELHQQRRLIEHLVREPAPRPAPSPARSSSPTTGPRTHRRGLGRGLEALIPPPAARAEPGHAPSSSRRSRRHATGIRALWAPRWALLRRSPVRR